MFRFYNRASPLSFLSINTAFSYPVSARITAKPIMCLQKTYISVPFMAPNISNSIKPKTITEFSSEAHDLKMR